MTEQEVIQTLKKMERDTTLVTNAAFTINSTVWPNNLMPFVEYHLHYLRTHKLTQPAGYLSNLRLRLKSKNKFK